MAVVQLAPGRHRRIVQGHPWVYKTEVESVNGDYQPGDMVDVVDHRGKYLGRGYINPRSQILVRIVTHRNEPMAGELIRQRLHEAWARRQRLLDDTDACRVVFGEADFLPGLIVDKFGSVLVLQTLSLGSELWKEQVADTLMDLLHPTGIYERNDVPVRELEGLPQQKGFLRGNFLTRFEMVENGIRMMVDVEQGQKTGHFLDQRLNRRAIRPYCRGARVLDAFCNTGGFALNAATAEAEDVLAVDASGEALAAAKVNAHLNGLDHRVRWQEDNVFDLLRHLDREKARFDVVILDPPAFAKNRAALEGAARGYKEINLRAMRMIQPGGYLVSCSCSFHMTPDLFLGVIMEAAIDSHRRLHLIEARAQSPDHPILLGYPESHYLKCFIFAVN